MSPQRENPQEEIFKSKITLFPCSWRGCSQKLESQGLLKAHVENHMQFHPKYICEFCDDNFKTENQMKNHIENEHNPKGIDDSKLTCTHCDFQTNSGPVLLKHLIVRQGHQPARPGMLDTNHIIQCRNCKIYFKSKHTLMEHRKTHHPSNRRCRDFLKGECLRSEEECWYVHNFNNENEVGQVKGNEEKIICFVCKKEFKTVYDMHAHKKVEHPSTTECFKFKEGKCTFGDKCWYSHVINSQVKNKQLNMNQKDLDFWPNLPNSQPPDQIMKKAMENIMHQMLPTMMSQIMNQMKFQL